MDAILLSDEILMEQFQNGDESAFCVLFDRYTPRLINFAYRFLHSRCVAEDIIQETFVRLYRGKDRYDTQRPFRPWMFSIASRLVSNCLRDRKRHQEVALEADYTDDENHSLKEVLWDKSSLPPLELSEKRETIRAVRQAINRLPENQRVAVFLARFEGMSYREISLAMSTSVSAIESLLFRARQTLKLDLSRTYKPHIEIHLHSPAAVEI